MLQLPLCMDSLHELQMTVINIKFHGVHYQSAGATAWQGPGSAFSLQDFGGRMPVSRGTEWGPRFAASCVPQPADKQPLPHSSCKQKAAKSRSLSPQERALFSLAVRSQNAYKANCFSRVPPPRCKQLFTSCMGSLLPAPADWLLISSIGAAWRGLAARVVCSAHVNKKTAPAAAFEGVFFKAGINI